MGRLACRTAPLWTQASALTVGFARTPLDAVAAAIRPYPSSAVPRPAADAPASVVPRGTVTTRHPCPSTRRWTQARLLSLERVDWGCQVGQAAPRRRVLRGFSVLPNITDLPEKKTDPNVPRGGSGAVTDPDEAVRAAIKAAVDAGRFERAARLLDVLRDAEIGQEGYDLANLLAAHAFGLTETRRGHHPTKSNQLGRARHVNIHLRTSKRCTASLRPIVAYKGCLRSAGNPQRRSTSSQCCMACCTDNYFRKDSPTGIQSPIESTRRHTQPSLD
jgi:hypothetical protein